MAEIVKLKKDGVTQYPVTKPECVIDENGKNVLQLIRENAGGDWNAKAGEAGYIDNKPFGEGFKAVEWFYSDGAGCCITPMISNKVKYEGVIYEIPDNTNEPVSLGDESFALGKYPYYDDNLMYVMCYGIQDENDERLQNILFEVNVKLDEKYIPDTIARTEYVTALEARIAALEAKLNS